MSRSPFPGMDPYLERHWPDIHISLVVGVADTLNASLPYDLVARIHERCEPDESETPCESDLSISDPIMQWCVRVLRGQRTVTVIEFAPPHHRGSGLGGVIDKREPPLREGANSVAIDLHRSTGAAPYRATTRIAGERETVSILPISLRQPLPAIRIPLRAGEVPIEVPLQPLVDRAYRNGRYARTIDYRRDPDPPLDAQDAAWADELLRNAGRR